MSPETPKCMKCDKSATHKITKIVKGKVSDLFLCDEHARTISPYLPSQKGDQGKLMELLQHFLKQQEDLLNSMAGQEGGAQEAEGAQPVPSGVICPNCGLAFAAYRKTLILGCSDCYSAFADLLIDDLRRMHGATSQQPIPEGEAAGRVASQTDQAPANVGAAVGAHVGEAPAKAPVKPSSVTLKERLAKLHKTLQEAIAREDFRAAVQVRDQIRTIEATVRRSEKTPTPEGGSVS